jgi:hypothetical protein
LHNFVAVKALPLMPALPNTASPINEQPTSFFATFIPRINSSGVLLRCVK